MFDVFRKSRGRFSVKKLSRIDLADDDVLVIHSDERLDPEVADKLEESLKKLFGYRREVLVFDKGVHLTVIGRQGDADADSFE